MEDLTAQKVNKWLFWIIIISFGFLTYMNFKGPFNRMIQILSNLPFWFILTTTVISTLLLIHFLNLGERKIKNLEENLTNGQKQLMEMERKFRLIKQDVLNVPKGGFKYYCADVLKALNYDHVDVLLDGKEVDIKAVDQNEELVYIKCIPASVENLREEIHQLYYRMLQDGIENGIVLTNSNFNEDDQRWAATFKIEYLNGKKINQIVQGLIDIDMSYFL